MMPELLFCVAVTTRQSVVITLTRGHHVLANKQVLALQTSVTLVTLLVLR